MCCLQSLFTWAGVLLARTLVGDACACELRAAVPRYRVIFITELYGAVVTVVRSVGCWGCWVRVCVVGCCMLFAPPLFPLQRPAGSHSPATAASHRWLSPTPCIVHTAMEVVCGGCVLAVCWRVCVLYIVSHQLSLRVF